MQKPQQNSSKPVEQYISRIVHHDQVVFIPKCKVSSILEKSNNLIYHIKRVKKTMIDHLSGHRKNKYDKIQHLFTIKKKTSTNGIEIPHSNKGHFKKIYS